MSVNIFPELQLLSTQNHQCKGATECSVSLFLLKAQPHQPFLLNQPPKLSFQNLQNSCSLQLFSEQIRKYTDT